MRLFLLGVCLMLTACATSTQENKTKPETHNKVMSCVHKYDQTVVIEFEEDDVTVYETELFDQMVTIYEIKTTDGKKLHLSGTQWVNFNCFYPQ